MIEPFKGYYDRLYGVEFKIVHPTFNGKMSEDYNPNPDKRQIIID